MTESSSTEDVFALLGNETRVETLQVLSGANEPLSFSEMFELVSISDSGQFNYHLDQLIGSFVKKNDDDKYELSYAGYRVVGAIYSGEFDSTFSLDTFSLESQCVTCSSQIIAKYDDEAVVIICDECGIERPRFWFPPGGVKDRSAEELTHVFDQWLRDLFVLKLEGICDNCAGPMNVWLDTWGDDIHPEDPICIVFDCERCPEDAIMSVSSYLFIHPYVNEVYEELGMRLNDVHAWNARGLLKPDIRVVEEDPYVVEVWTQAGDETVGFKIDSSFEIQKL